MTSHRFTRTVALAACKGIAAGIAAALLVVGAPAAARPRSELLQAEQGAEPAAPAQQDRLMPVQRGGGVSLQQATSMAQNAFPGTVAGARTVQMGDRTVHEIRILGQDGRTVRTFRIDAQTGAFL
jgi:uncharacterized membrane protein YkoI